MQPELWPPLLDSPPEPKEPRVRTVFNIVAAVAGVVGFGLDQEGSHPYFGLLLVVGALLYGFWELFTSPYVKAKLHLTIRVALAIVMFGVLFWVSLPHVLEIVRPKKLVPAPPVISGPKDYKPLEQTPPFSTSPKPEPKPARVVPMKDPLEIVAFDTHRGISIANNGPLEVFVVNLYLKASYPQTTANIDLNFNIPARDVGHKPLTPAIQSTHTIRALASTWAEHFDKAMTMYSSCGKEIAYLSPSDSGFQNVKSFFESHGETFAYGDVAGVIGYRVHGYPQLKEQTVSAVMTLVVDSNCQINPQQQ